MDKKPKYALRVDNVYFLKQMGTAFRKAVADLPRDELPDNVVLLQRRDRLEEKIRRA